MRDYETFRGETLVRMKARRRDDGRRWTYTDLAKATVYKVNTIEQFMGGRKITDNVALAIAKALDIPEHMAT